MMNTFARFQEILPPVSYNEYTVQSVYTINCKGGRWWCVRFFALKSRHTRPMYFISTITTCWGRRECVQVGESDRCAVLDVRMFVVDMIGGGIPRKAACDHVILYCWREV